MSTSSFEHPQQFKAAVWPKENAQLLEIKNVEWRNPQHGQVVIKVHVAGINSTDNISRYNLIGKIHYPTTPGSNVVGEIVQVGQGVKHFKQGQHVVAILSHKGLGEYCVADEQFICLLNDKQKSREEIVVQAFEGARIEGSIRRFEREMEHEDQQRCQEINKRMGFEGSGICVVYGEGGCAKLALDLLRNCQSRMMKDFKFLLISTSEKWKAQDYGLQDQDMLCAGKHDIAKELRTRGGAHFVLGERPYQEDAYSVHSLAIPRNALKWNVMDDRMGAGWNPTLLEGFDGEAPGNDEDMKRQVAFFGVFDGHGGSQASKFLQQKLHRLLESATAESIPPTIDEYRGIGGYLKRYQGGILERFRKESENYNERVGISLDEMSVLAFLQADNAVLADESTGKSGSTATVALLHSLDLPHSFPYYASSLLSLTISHLGDTTALLSTTAQGRARRLTEPHHGDSRVEGERLRTSGTGIVTDSFGESRWGGTLANTRGIGDREFKSLGVIGEPEITKRVLKGEEWSFLVLLSDGITDVISDQEIIDLARGHKDPTQAAKKIVSFAEDVGGEDNMTCIVVPLPGWGKMGGMDTTADRREYRVRQFSGASRRQKRM